MSTLNFIQNIKIIILTFFFLTKIELGFSQVCIHDENYGAVMRVNNMLCMWYTSLDNNMGFHNWPSSEQIYKETSNKSKNYDPDKYKVLNGLNYDERQGYWNYNVKNIPYAYELTKAILDAALTENKMMVSFEQSFHTDIDDPSLPYSSKRVRLMDTTLMACISNDAINRENDISSSDFTVNYDLSPDRNKIYLDKFKHGAYVKGEIQPINKAVKNEKNLSLLLQIEQDKWIQEVEEESSYLLLDENGFYIYDEEGNPMQASNHSFEINWVKELNYNAVEYREDWIVTKDNDFFMLTDMFMPRPYKISDNKIKYDTYKLLTPQEWSSNNLEVILPGVSYIIPFRVVTEYNPFMLQILELIKSKDWSIYNMKNKDFVYSEGNFMNSKQFNSILEFDALCANDQLNNMDTIITKGIHQWMFDINYGENYPKLDDEGYNVYDENGYEVYLKEDDKYIPNSFEKIQAIEFLVDWKQDKESKAIVKEVKGFSLIISRGYKNSFERKVYVRKNH